LHYYIIYNTLKLDQTCVRRTTKAFSDSENNDDRIKEHDRLTSLDEARDWAVECLDKGPNSSFRAATSIGLPTEFGSLPTTMPQNR
jgi:predicted aminopeptidase